MTTKAQRTTARIILLAIALGAAASLTYCAQKTYNFAKALHKRAFPEKAGLGENKKPDQNKIISLSQELTEKIERHGQLPERSLLSMLGFPSWQPDKVSNTASMEELLEILATEIGSTQTLGALRTLRKNREEQNLLQTNPFTENPLNPAEIQTRIKKLEEENEKLEEILAESLGKEGIPLNKDQIRALCASPNAEDLASMISAFSTLKAVSAEMERRLRTKPTQEHAQRYYGSHTVMLMALDKIQKHAADRILNIHIPKAQQIAQEAKTTAQEAENLLKTDNGDLSQNEKTALNWNIQSCQKTIEISNRTQQKLQKNLEIIQKANKKLEKSIATAKNSHMTAMLQKEILLLEIQGPEEFARIEALTIPELAAVNFADPEKPIVSKKIQETLY